MRILLAADLHSDLGAYRAFASALGRYDCGVLAGDLLDEFITHREAVEFGLVPALEPEELWDESDHPEADFAARLHDAVANPLSVNRRGLELKRTRVQSVLAAAGKPVFFVGGNHDLVPWPDLGPVVNIEERRVEFGGLGFVGFNRASLSIGEEERRRALDALVPLVGQDTVFVTHLPPLGVRDAAGDEAGSWSLGSPAVAAFVERTRPRWVFCGHVHGDFGRRGTVVNGAWARSHRFAAVDTKTSRVRYRRPQPKLI